MTSFTRVFTSFADGFKTARLHHTLNRMSDRQLADIGLSRENVSLRALAMAQTR